MVDVRRARPDDLEGCIAVLATLPAHFTRDTHEDLRRRFDQCTVYVAEESDSIVGCVLLQDQYMGAEIYYAGVIPERQRNGIGRRMIALLLDETDRPVIEVKTLDASSDYGPYIATRAFWEAMGFVQIDRIDPLPGWQPGNPAAIYVCALAPTATEAESRTAAPAV